MPTTHFSPDWAELHPGQSGAGGNETSAERARLPPPSGFVSPSFDDVYAATFPSVWRSVRRLGVVDSAVDDVVQEVFVAVHRRLGQFEGRCTLRTWVFGIVVRVVNNYRRTGRRKGAAHATTSHVEDPGDVMDSGADPFELTSRAEAGRTVRRLLAHLEANKAAVFVLAELEGLTVPEIAEATGVNLNTIYSRLRAARKDFERARKHLELERTSRAR